MRRILTPRVVGTVTAWISETQGSQIRHAGPATTPLGGRTSLPPRRLKIGEHSNARTTVRSHSKTRELLRKKRRALDRNVFDSRNLHQALEQGLPQVPITSGDVPEPAHPPEIQTDQLAVASSTSHFRTRLQELVVQNPDDESDGKAAPVHHLLVPQMTVFADQLDRFERERQAEQELHHSAVKPFTPDEVYDASTLVDSDSRTAGGMSMCERDSIRRSVRRASYVDQHPLSYHRRLQAIEKKDLEDFGEEFRRQLLNPSSTRAVNPPSFHNSCLVDKNEPSTPDDDAHLNPHFPCEAESSSANIAPSSPLQNSPPPPSFDAYVTRPHKHQLVSKRDETFWDIHENRKRVEELQKQRDEAARDFFLKENLLDNVRAEHHSQTVRHETMVWYRNNPINDMIQNHFVRIVRILPADGSDEVYFEDNEQVEITLSEAKAMARDHGLDLVRTAEIASPVSLERGTIAVCALADHRQLLRDMIRIKLHIKGGIQPPRTEACVEVPFRGGIHPHSIRFKAVGIAKMLVRQTPIRVNLTDFGTPREGFPILQSILDEIKKQCLPIHAFHTCSPIQSNYDEIFCFLHPSTARNPKVTIHHPAEHELEAAERARIMEDEKEMWFDDYYNQPTLRDRNRYAAKLEDGTAWSEKDEGLSLKRQRDMKVMLGYLPKGNKELYAGRGDVDIPFPFRTMHPTTTEKWNYLPESNLDQAARASAVLGKRHSMNIADMHAQGETEENPSVIDRFYFKMQGPALRVGEFKEALGLKSNRKKVPGLGPGWATLGVKNTMGQEPFSAAK